GIGVTAASLSFARDQVLKGVEPWKSYYAAMSASKYASTTLVSKNVSPVLDHPALSSFTSTKTESKLIEDSWGAYTQALLYYFTGNNVYRANAMKIVRIWSNMDPTQYAYYPDSQIHTGVPLYRLLAAAELLRATSYDSTYTAYDLAWHDSDNVELTTNLINPMLAVFEHRNTNYMNQHTYPLIGAIAAYIFTDNRPRYDEAVEWYTVNATTARPEQNGALAPIYPLIAADNPLNHYGYPFVQHQEMGRDQAHAGDDVDNLAGLARILTVQGTKVDPVHGTVSTAPDAVDPYHFLGDRLLAGSDAYARFMLGYDTPWIDTSGGPGSISSGYRGRLIALTEINEIYDQYEYTEGVDVDKDAPYLAKAHEQAEGPLFHNGSTTLSNFWGGQGAGIDTGPEYWLSFPAALAGQAPPVATSPAVQAVQKGLAFDGGTVMTSDASGGYASMHASSSGTTLVVHDLTYSDRTKYAPVGLMIRTNGSGMRLAIAKDQHTPAFRTISLPNTGGQWRYVTYDVALTTVRSNQAGDNIGYYTLTGPDGGTADIRHVNTLAASQLSIPQFPQGLSTDVIGVAKEQFTRSFAATDANPRDVVTYRAEGLPDGAVLDSSTGAFTWTPTQPQTGTYHFTVVADNGTVDSVLEVTLVVAPNREQACRQALTGYDPKQVYTTGTLGAFTTESDQVWATLHSATDADFISSLVQLQGAVRGLRLLNPLLPDGTLAFPPLVTSSLSALNVANLVDSDFNTTSGDLHTPFWIDFGAGFKVTASAFGLQARYGFANRSQGANVYGSDDGVAWTLLTSRETTNTTAENYVMETIPVLPSVQGMAFRYFKVQVDDPGIPTDPAYPGLSSFGEMRIHGVRGEAS
ncbi:MAG: putative Ig domain-containing protein, partial [Streptomyces sp.]|uniref:putative Ig domain-containing protein n=1 Tax=Streptomyces sp. TaxID=1931 RepID=UPI0025E86A70